MKPATLLFSVLASATAHAATLMWDGAAGDGLWTSPVNWSSDALPTATDDVQLADGASATLGDGSSQSIQGLLLGGTGTSGSLTLSGGSTLASNGLLSLAADTGRVANITLSGDSSWTHTGSASVGVNTGIVNWTMSDGADFAFDSGSSTIVVGNNSGTTVALSLDGAGTTFDGGGHLLRMGRKGTFDLTLTNGASFQAQNMDFGIQGEGTPTVNVLSGSSFLSTGSTLFLYNDTDFLVDNATFSASNAVVTLSGNATITGQAGATVTASAGLAIGGTAGVTLTGSGTQGTVGTSLTMDGSDSSLTLADSADLTTSGTISLANAASTSATINMSGGASWTHTQSGSTDTMIGGNGGDLTWSVTDGASVHLNRSSSDGFLFAGSGGSVDLTVSGTGTVFDHSDTSWLEFGRGGDFTLLLSDGAVLGNENGNGILLGRTAGGAVSVQVLSGATLKAGFLELNNSASLLVDNSAVEIGDFLEIELSTNATATFQNGATLTDLTRTRLDGNSTLTFDGTSTGLGIIEMSYGNLVAKNGATLTGSPFTLVGGSLSLDGSGTSLTFANNGNTSGLQDGANLTVQNGASIVFTGSSDFDLHLANSPGTFLVTGTGSTAIFGAGLTNTATNNPATFTVSAGAEAIFLGTVGFTGSHQFTVTGEDSLADMDALSTGGGAFTVTDEATLIANTLELGITAGQNASLTLGDSGVGSPTVRFGNAVIGGTGSADGGSATVAHESGIFQIGQTSGGSVGLTGSRLVVSGGTLTLRNGAQWRSQSSAWIAPESGKSGTVTVQGGDTLFHIDDHLILGGTSSADGGSATFTHSSGVVRIGDSLPGISGDAFVVANSNADGDGGTLTLRNSAVLTTVGTVSLANVADTSANILMSGGASWTHTQSGSTDTMIGGNGGDLTWSVTGGASVHLNRSSLAGFLFAGSGGSLDLTVSGSGSTFDTSDRGWLQIGQGGDATVLVSDGAVLGNANTEGLILGRVAGGAVSAQVLSGATLKAGFLELNNGASLLVDNAAVEIGAYFEIELSTNATATFQNGATLTDLVRTRLDNNSTLTFDGTSTGLGLIEMSYGNLVAKNGATLTGSPFTLVGGSLSLDGSGTSLTFANNGNTSGLYDGASLTVQNGASIAFTGSTDFDLHDSNSPASTFLVTGNGSTAIFGAGLTNTSTNNPAAFRVENGASASFGGDISLTGSHTVTVTGVGSALSAANLFLGGGGNTLTISDGGTLTVTGTLGAGAADGIGVEGGAHLHVGTTSVSGSVLIDDGTLHFTADGAPALGSIAVASGGATLDTGSHAISLSAPVSGSGAFAKTGAGTLALVAASTHSGAFTVSAGTLQLDGSVASAALVVSPGATLAGSGSASAAALSIAGTLDPGATSAAGLFTAASASFSSTATASFQLGGDTAGSGHDQLVTSGLTSFGGTLSVTLIDGYAPSAGASFTLFSAGSYAGAFATRDLPAGYAWDISRLESEGILSVAVIPEPASLAILLGLASLAGPVLRRRPAPASTAATRGAS